MIALERELLQFIFGLSPLAWQKFQQRKSPTMFTNRTQDAIEDFLTPYVAFRFQKEDPVIMERLHQAVGSFHGSIEWSLWAHERDGLPGTNWAIGPERLFQVGKEAWAEGVGAGDYLARTEPGLAIAALDDLPGLIGHIKGQFDSRHPQLIALRVMTQDRKTSRK
jgi:hypothetical protein